ncbi:hypothetical protein WR25_10136 [Diploscapter pachys]|uniref:Uncharacterized protein n=1 Tax=Diploscapter pachys TaxID=2018661 RepID=A0A2A2JWM8_9BILA|nr:hypothetical protein WR25_10136 [Diploscapter pachys]
MFGRVFDIFDQHAIGVTHQHVATGRNRLCRFQDRATGRREMRGERVQILDHEGRFGGTERRQAFVGAGDEQDRGDLRQLQVMFRIVERQTPLLPDQGFIEADGRIDLVERKVAADEDVQDSHIGGAPKAVMLTISHQPDRTRAAGRARRPRGTGAELWRGNALRRGLHHRPVGAEFARLRPPESCNRWCKRCPYPSHVAP